LRLSRLLRKIVDVEGEDVTGELRKLHNEELHVFYSSPDTVWVIKYSINSVMHVAGIGGGGEKLWWGN
jgi:hypothetical protein